MRKLFVFMLTVSIVFSLLSCSGDTPAPQVPAEEKSDFEVAGDVIDMSSTVFDGLKEEIDENGVSVKTVSEDTDVGNYTVLKGSYEETSEGHEEKNLKIAYTDDDGASIEIRDVSRMEIMLDEKTVTSESERSEAENALNLASRIASTAFKRETGEDGSLIYTYEKESTARSLVSEDEISKVVITLSSDSDSASCKREVTYLENGEENTVTKLESKKTHMMKNGKSVDLKNDFESFFSIQSIQAETIKLSFSEVHADGYPTTMADREFARLVEERTYGRIKIDVHSGGTLYGEETGAIKALQIGDLDFARVSASPVKSFVHSIGVLELPYIFISRNHMWKVLNGPIGQDMLEGIQASGSGLVGLCYYDAGARNFYTKTPVQSVKDMTGLRIRVQNNPMMVDMVELLGGNGVTGIGPNEVYSAISQGTIDGAENNWPTYESMGDYEAAPYIILDGHTRVPEILLASEKVINKVSAEDWEIIKKCAKEAQAYEIEKWVEREEESRNKIQNEINIYEPTPELYDEVVNLMQPLYEKYGAEYENIIEDIHEARSEIIT